MTRDAPLKVLTTFASPRRMRVVAAPADERDYLGHPEHSARPHLRKQRASPQNAFKHVE